MGIGQPPARRAYAPEGAHRASCIEQGERRDELKNLVDFKIIQ